MIKYRKKPIEVEAVQWTGYNTQEVVKFTSGNCSPALNSVYRLQGQLPTDIHMHINTLEGTMEAKVNDYIIKGIKGEFYPCDKEIFEKTYERVE